MNKVAQQGNTTIPFAPSTSGVAPKQSPLKGLDLGKPLDVYKSMTFNSPIVQGAVNAGAGWLAGKYLTPLLMPVLSPKLLGGRSVQDMSQEEYDDLIKNMQTLGVIGGLGLTVGANYNASRPWYGFKKNDRPSRPILSKTSSGVNDPFSMSLGQARYDLEHNNNLNSSTKRQAITVLNAFNAPEETPITRKDIIRGAVNTGLSSAFNGAIGFVAANALGFPNPVNTGALVATVSAISKII